MRAKDLVFLSGCTMLALYSRGFCLSACLLKFVSLGISLCSDYANFTAKANAFALPRIERLGRQAYDCKCTCSHTLSHSHTLDSYSTLFQLWNPGIQVAYMRHIPIYHIVRGSHHTSLVVQHSNCTDVFPMQHFLSHIEKTIFPSNHSVCKHRVWRAVSV